MPSETHTGKPLYPIRAVSRITGLSVETLRAWERRYEAVTPQRGNRGRLYSEDDVSRLGQLRDAVSRGHAIGQIAGLSDEQLSVLTASRAGEGRSAEPQPEGDTVRISLDAARRAIERFDVATLDRELGRLAALLTARELIVTVVQPLMEWTGERWLSGALSIAQEHVASAGLRNLLGTLARLHTAPRPAATLVFGTPAGERHEFGVLSAAMLAAGGGLDTVYLGPDLPTDEIAGAVRATKARAAVIGVTGASEPGAAVAALEKLCSEMPAGTEVWAGGCKSANLARELKSLPLKYLENFDELAENLVRLGARF